MRDRRHSDTESTVLSELAAIRLLERASELDAARAAGIQLADLRAAATQAGISGTTRGLPVIRASPAALKVTRFKVARFSGRWGRINPRPQIFLPKIFRLSWIVISVRLRY